MSDIRELIFQDTCVIYGNEVVDENGDVSYEEIYNGMCDFQEAHTVLIRNIYSQREPTLFLPYEEGKELNFVINGRVVITQFGCGKQIEANIRSCNVENVYNKLIGINLNLADVRIL